MAKRFVDTEIWNKSWYQELSLKEKLLVKYIFENCDCAGVWDINFRLASFIIGESIILDDIVNINKKNELFAIFDKDKIFVVDFIKFQYGTLSENCKPHKPIIEKIKKYNLFERVSKGYSKGIETLEEKEKEKEQDKEINTDPFNSKNKKIFYEEYQKVFNKKVYLGRNELIRLLEIAKDNNLEDVLPIALNRLKNIEFKDIDFKPSANWLLRGNNFERVMNGEFGSKEEEKQQAIQQEQDKQKEGLERLRALNPELAEQLERTMNEV